MARFSYDSGNLISSGALTISGAWLLYFCTTFRGLAVFQATIIFSIATYLDITPSPLMGFITDNLYQTKLGHHFSRCCFFILIAIPYMIIYPLLQVNGVSSWYYPSTYIIFEVVHATIMVSYNILPVEMTKDFNQKTYLIGSKAMFGKVANFLAAATPGTYFYFLSKDSATLFFLTGLTYAIIMITPLIILYFNSWERPIDDVADESAHGLMEGFNKLFIDLFSTFKLKAFRIYLGMCLFGFGAEQLLTVTFTYFIVFNLKQPRTFVPEMNSLSSICQFFSTAFFMVWCAKRGFRRSFIVVILVVVSSVIGYVGVYCLNIPHLTWLITGIAIWFGLGTGGVYYIPWSVYVLLADVDEILIGRRREGLYAGVMIMVGKPMRATVVFCLGAVLSLFGFESGIRHQSASTVDATNGVMIFGVADMALIGTYFPVEIKLDKAFHTETTKELECLKKGGRKEDATPEIRKLVK